MRNTLSELAELAESIGGPLYKDIWGLYVDRDRLHWLVETANSNSEIPAPWEFLAWLVNLYGDHVCMAVRRHADKVRRSQGLRRLVWDVGSLDLDYRTYLEYRKQRSVNRNRLGYIDLFIEISAHEAFDSIAGTSDVINKKSVKEDIADIDREAQEVWTYATKTIAHSDPAHPQAPTFDEIDKTVDAIAGVARKYYAFLRGGDVELGVTDNTDWKAAFLVPWWQDDVYLEGVRERHPRG